MKIILAAVAITLAMMGVADASHHERHARSSHQFDIEDAMNNKGIVLMALGTAVYYSEFCAGLTGRGKMYLKKAIKLHEIDFNTMGEDKDYKIGYRTAESYPTCGKFRFAISDAGLGAMIR
jgi:hypothetical protein